MNSEGEGIDYLYNLYKEFDLLGINYLRIYLLLTGRQKILEDIMLITILVYWISQ